jgi:hypothetical protein
MKHLSIREFLVAPGDKFKFGNIFKVIKTVCTLYLAYLNI